MVYVEDMGTILEVPMADMESFLESVEHSSTHSEDVRNFEVVESTGPTIVLSYERKHDGHWKKSGTRVTSFAPFCRWVEELEGDFAGSRFVVVHRPDGAKTRVDVFGDIQIKGKSPEQIRTLWLGILAKTQSEDEAALRKFRDRK